MMKTTYSVELEANAYMDDLFNGTLEECREYIANNYTAEEIAEENVRIAKILVDEYGCVAECLDIIDAE